MRGVFSIVSLLVVCVAAALYFTSAQPVVLQQPGGYQNLQLKAENAVKQQESDPQAEVDAASHSPSPPPATNAPPSGN